MEEVDEHDQRTLIGWIFKEFRKRIECRFVRTAEGGRPSFASCYYVTGGKLPNLPKDLISNRDGLSSP